MAEDRSGVHRRGAVWPAAGPRADPRQAAYPVGSPTNEQYAEPYLAPYSGQPYAGADSTTAGHATGSYATGSYTTGSYVTGSYAADARSEPAYDAAAHANQLEEQRRQATLEQQARSAAISRMRKMNAMHGMHAYDNRGKADALGPHGVAFLYRDVAVSRTDGSPQQSIVAGTRLFRASEDVTDVVELLGELAQQAYEYARTGGFNPLTVMCDRYDDMTVRAEFAGVGVSSLDTPIGTWKQVNRSLPSALDVPGCVYIWLWEDTRLMLERGGPHGSSGREYASHPVPNLERQLNFTSWRYLPRQPELDPLRDLWSALHSLQHWTLQGIRALRGH